MATTKEAQTWQRMVAATLAVGGGSYDLFISGISSWLDGVVAIAAIYGLYLFGYFALEGRLPGACKGDRFAGLASGGGGAAK